MGNGFDSPEDFAGLVHGWISDAHKDSALAPIRFPDPHGAFPQDILLRPPPVVVDANVFRNDILRACRKGQRTVLVTAANAGLLRMFCDEPSQGLLRAPQKPHKSATRRPIPTGIPRTKRHTPVHLLRVLKARKTLVSSVDVRELGC